MISYLGTVFLRAYTHIKITLAEIVLLGAKSLLRTSAFIIYHRIDGGCRHLAAALFDLQETLYENKRESCTAEKCQWKKRAKHNEQDIQLKDLNLSKAEYGKVNFTYPSHHHSYFDPRPTYSAEDYTSLIDVLWQTVPSAGILTWIAEPVKPMDVDEVKAHVSDDMNVHRWEDVDGDIKLPTIKEFGNIFLENKKGTLQKPDLTVGIKEEFLSSICMTKAEREMLNAQTVGQGKTPTWMDHRARRITA